MKKETKNIIFRVLLITFKVLLIVVLFIFIPSVTNNILSLNILSVGEGKDWLSFFGSYIGGIVTAFISFIILLSTIRNSQNESEINRQNDKFTKLQDDLKSRVATLNFRRIGNVSSIIDNYEICKNETLNLDYFQQELKHNLNSFTLIYENTNNQTIITFKNTYTLCITILLDDIREMKELISKLEPKVSKQKIESLEKIVSNYELNNASQPFYSKTDTDFSTQTKIIEYKDIINSQKQRENIRNEVFLLFKKLSEKESSYIYPVYIAARDWLDEEESKLKGIKMKKPFNNKPDRALL